MGTSAKSQPCKVFTMAGIFWLVWAFERAFSPELGSGVESLRIVNGFSSRLLHSHDELLSLPFTGTSMAPSGILLIASIKSIARNISLILQHRHNNRRSLNARLETQLIVIRGGQTYIRTTPEALAIAPTASKSIASAWTDTTPQSLFLRTCLP